jgi:hypothetical protein
MSQLLLAVVVGLVMWLRHLLALPPDEADEAYVLHRIYTAYTCFLLSTACLFNDFCLEKYEGARNGPYTLAR